jgi:hypothetical protein
MIGWIVKTTQNDKATPTPIFGKDFAIGQSRSDRSIRPTEESCLGSRFAEGSASCAAPHVESEGVFLCIVRSAGARAGRVCYA